jgi:mono/diheme cytochrome c family protein
MTMRSFARPAAALVAAIAFVACHSSATSTTTAPIASANAAAALPFTPLMVAQGDSLFHTHSCARCHGPDAKGAANAPNLTSGPFLHMNGSYDEIVRIVTNGIPADSIKDKSHRFAMRPRGGQQPLLTDDEVRAVAAYVYSLSHH